VGTSVIIPVPRQAMYGPAVSARVLTTDTGHYTIRPM